MHCRASDALGPLSLEKRAALLFIDEYGHRRDYTFAEVDLQWRRYAAVLRAFGVHEDDHVYVCLSGTAKCIFTLLALEQIGAKAILDEREAGGATAIITNRKHRPRIEYLRARFSPDARYLLIGEERDGWARLDTLAQIASPVAESPSGTRVEALERARKETAKSLGAVETDIVWCALTTEDALWLQRAVAQPWLLGGAAVVHDHPFDPQERLDLTRELEVTILLQHAQEYDAQLDLPDPKRFKMPRLRRCLVLDDGADADLQSRWAERFGVSLTSASGEA